jgi:hypothetical protein
MEQANELRKKEGKRERREKERKKEITKRKIEAT